MADPPRIEFVDGAADEPDEGESLDTGPRRPLRRWWAAAAVVVVAGAVVLGVRHRSSDGPAPEAAPSTTSGPTAVLAPSFSQVVIDMPGAIRIADPSRCPTGVPCVEDGGSTAALSAALLDALAGARIVSVRTVRTVDTHQVWYRQVVAIAGTTRVLIEVSRAGKGARSTTAQTTDTMTFVREVVDGLLLQIRADGAADHMPSTDQLFALSEDARLAT